MSYLSIAEFRLRTIMPQSDVDALEVSDPGFLSQCLADWSSEIDARLRKRYAIPFLSPVPPTVMRWLVKLVTRDAYAKRGYNPSARADAESIEGAALRVEKEISEAANSKDGLFEFPLASGASAISRGGPHCYSEVSPYRWTDIEARLGPEDDERGY